MEYPYQFRGASSELSQTILGLLWALGWVDVLYVGYLASVTTQWGTSEELWDYIYPGIALAVVAVAGLWAFGRAVFWPKWLGRCAAVPRHVMLSAFIVALANTLLVAIPLLLIAMWHRSVDGSVYLSATVGAVLGAVVAGTMFVLWRREKAVDP